MTKKNRAVWIVLVVMLCLLALLTLFACGNNGGTTDEPSENTDPDNNDPTKPVVDHTEHVWVTGVTVPGTCISEGYTTETCSIGGETREISTGKKGSHEYINHICKYCGERERGEAVLDGAGRVIGYGEYVVGSLTVYRYVLTQTISGEKTYNFVVSGTGRIPDFESADDCPWKEFSPKVARIEFLAGVTYIGAHFADGMESLSALVIPSSVTEIGEYAFRGCSSLMEFSVGTALTTVGCGAFEGCSLLRNVELSARTTAIGFGAFKGCSQMRSLSFGGAISSDILTEESFFGSMFDRVSPTSEDAEQVVEITENGVTTTYAFNLPDYLLRVYVLGGGTIPRRFFENCGVVENVYVQGPVTEVEDRAFYGTKAMKYVEFTQNTLTRIGEEAFARSAALGAPKPVVDDEEASKRPQTIVFPESLREIGFGAFQYCGELVTVILNGTYESIPDCAFTGCSKLSNVTIADTVKSVGEEAFASTALSSFRAGEALNYVGSEAFSGCYRLNTVVVDSLNVFRLIDDYGKLYNSAKQVWVKGAVIEADDEAIREGSSYVKTKMTYKGYNKDREPDYIGYHLWEKD